jgi:hypothetical protein
MGYPGRVRWSRLTVVVVTVAAFAAQGRAAPLFTHPPADIARVAGVVPLGNLNPGGGHVRAVDHMYLRYVDPANGGEDAVTVRAMASGKIVLVTRTLSGDDPKTDHSLFIQHDAHVTSQFDHLHALSGRLKKHLAKRPGGWIAVREGFEVMFLGELGAPPPLAVAGGEKVGATRSYSHAWDVGVTDARVKRKFLGKGKRRYPTFVDFADALGVALDENPFPGHPTLNAACFLDYLAPALRAEWQELLVSDPKSCGRPDWDLKGKLRGTWFNQAVDAAAEPPVFDLERAAIAIVPHNFRPEIEVQIGIGSGHPLAALDPGGMHPQLRNRFVVTFDPAPAARVNPDPAKVTVAQAPVCYDLRYGQLFNLLLLDLVAPKRLLVHFDPTPRQESGCAAALAGPAPAWTATYVR